MALVTIWSLATSAGAQDGEVGEKVVLRAGTGRFVRVAEDGSVRADRFVPLETETFELTARAGDMIALRDHDGRFLALSGPEGSHLVAGSAGPQPDAWENLSLVPLGGNRVAIQGPLCPDLVSLDGTTPALAEPEQAGEPTPGQTVEVYRAGQVPGALPTALGMVVTGLVVQELAHQQYDNVRTRKKEEYIELPAPTLRDLGRKKRHRVLSMDEEYHVQARLDGRPDIRITSMPYLKGYRQRGVGLLMFVCKAVLPVQGRVRYRIPNRLSASTGYRTVIHLTLLGEVRAEKSDDQLSLQPPEILHTHVELRRLDLSNDLLNVARAPIEDFINAELRRKQDRIRDQANESIHKALQTREFRHPLLRYLALP